MPLITHTCVTAHCDTCGEEYAPDDYDVHFDTVPDAQRLTRADGWTVTADGQVLCDARDDEHAALLAALMPPEPFLQVPGQLGFDTGDDIGG